MATTVLFTFWRKISTFFNRRSERLKAEHLWQECFHNLPIGISIVKASSPKVFRVNAAFAAMHGMTLDEIADATWEELYTPESFAEMADNLAKADKTGHTIYHCYHR